MEECKLWLPSLISDGMVLQRDLRVKVWGKATPGMELVLELLNKVYKTGVSEDGCWEILLDKMSPGGPYDMMIRCNEEEKVIRDIYIGDVWVLGGQSNMQIQVRRTFDLFEEEVKEADCPEIRRFDVPQEYNFHGPVEELTDGSWIPVTPESISEFSAIGYFFARMIHAKYHIPIGLLHTAIGGTPAEAWISENTLSRFERFTELVSLIKDDSYVNRIKAEDEKINNSWYQELEETDEGLKNKEKPWYSEELTDEDWKEMNIPASFMGTELEAVKGGAVWFRKEIILPEQFVGKEGKLVLGTVIDADDTYINGVRVGSTGYLYPPRRYPIPEGLLKAGRNVIAVRVILTQNIGAFVTDMPYFIQVDGRELPISGTWKYKIGAILRPMSTTTFFQYKPSGVYNAMIYPLRKFGVKGILWYQGESNTGYPYDYKELFDAVISDWRSTWKLGELPFIYVQLANFCPWRMEPEESGWARLREEQRQALSIPGTGMAVTIDVGMYNDLHPWDKKSVGERLALWARNMVYGESIVCSGPVFDSMKTEGNKIRLNFRHTGSGLMAKDGALRMFEICGQDGRFYPADAVIEGENVIVSGDKVLQPVNVRYAWADNPEEANLYNREGLPASPFIAKL